jgi:hypothetical protein
MPKIWKHLNLNSNEEMPNGLLTEILYANVASFNFLSQSTQPKFVNFFIFPTNVLLKRSTAPVV